jgi:hypothetical protein
MQEEGMGMTKMHFERLRTLASRCSVGAISLAAAVLSSGAFAGELAVPNVFSAGDPAVAAEVNENFSATAAAVNDNDARVETLETKVSALETALAALTTRTETLEAKPDTVLISDDSPPATDSLSPGGGGAFGPRIVLRSISVPAGSYLVSANANILGMDETVAACELRAVRDADGAERLLAEANLYYEVLGTAVSGGFNVPAPLVAKLGEFFTPATIEYACQVASTGDPGDRQITRASLHAISAVSSTEQ